MHVDTHIHKERHATVEQSNQKLTVRHFFYKCNIENYKYLVRFFALK